MYSTGHIKYAAVVSCFIAIILAAQNSYADDQCKVQDYESDREPDFKCPSPGELELLGHVDLERPVVLKEGDIAPYEGALYTKAAIIETDLQIMALRQLRWLDGWKRRRLHLADTELRRSMHDAKLVIAEAEILSLKQENSRLSEEAEVQWYEEPVLWLAVGTVIGAVLGGGIGYGYSLISR